jgi:hypothetical protein
MLAYEVISLYHQILLRWTQFGTTQHCELATWSIRQGDIHLIMDVNRIEHRLEVVITIRTLAYYVQSQIYFCTRKVFQK